MTELLKQPRAFISTGDVGWALATVIGYATMFGTVRQADDGAAAHIWQILMVGQVPADVFAVNGCRPPQDRR